MKSRALVPFKLAARGLDAALLRALQVRTKGPANQMYKMPQYFMGYLEKDLKTKASPRGKRFRPYLAMYLAEAYDVKREVFDAALAIEVFHNFTLIHDDVEDNDEYRRDRPTVWKLWGVNHAINSGDALSLIASELCVEVAAASKIGQDLARTLLKAFRGVCEGQYLDFQLADASMKSRTISERAYLVMAEKKAGVLVGISAEAAGIASKQTQQEREALREFGTQLGTTYQIADDYRSIWGKSTGKDIYGDVRERKRSLPIITAVSHSVGRNQARLIELFDQPRRLMDLEVIEAVSLIDASGAQTMTLEVMQAHVGKTRAAVNKLHIKTKHRKALHSLIKFLIPEVK